MNALSSYACSHVLDSLFAVAYRELSPAAIRKERQAAEAETEVSVRNRRYRMIELMEAEAGVCRRLMDAEISAAKDSLSGDEVLPRLYRTGGGWRLQPVDILSDRPEGWLLSECKFAILYDPCATFGNYGKFKAKILNKFEDVERLLTEDAEICRPQRIILVAEERVPECRNIFRRLCLGSAGSMLEPRRYIICSLRDFSAVAADR